MTNLPALPATVNQQRLSVGAHSTLQWLESWTAENPVPTMLTESKLKAAISEAERLLRPCDPKIYLLVMDRLFTGLQMPSKEALMVWREILAPYPADVLKRATDYVLRTHKWETPPKVAQLVEACDQDPDYRERRLLLTRGKMALAKLESQNRRVTWDKMTETERQQFDQEMAHLREALAERKAEMV